MFCFPLRLKLAKAALVLDSGTRTPVCSSAGTQTRHISLRPVWLPWHLTLGRLLVLTVGYKTLFLQKFVCYGVFAIEYITGEVPSNNHFDVVLCYSYRYPQLRVVGRVSEVRLYMYRIVNSTSYIVREKVNKAQKHTLRRKYVKETGETTIARKNTRRTTRQLGLRSLG